MAKFPLVCFRLSKEDYELQKELEKEQKNTTEAKKNDKKKGDKEGIQWLHKLVTEDLVDPEAFTQEWSTYVAKGKNHRYGLCFTWDIANIDNNEDYVMLPALTGPDGMRNITRQNNSETSGFDRGRCVLTSSCRDTALAAAWMDQMCTVWKDIQRRINHFLW